MNSWSVVFVNFPQAEKRYSRGTLFQKKNPTVVTGGKQIHFWFPFSSAIVTNMMFVNLKHRFTSQENQWTTSFHWTHVNNTWLPTQHREGARKKKISQWIWVYRQLLLYEGRVWHFCEEANILNITRKYALGNCHRFEWLHECIFASCIWFFYKLVVWIWKCLSPVVFELHFYW